MTRAADTIWEVFARKEYEDPLHHVGTVTESDEDLALVSARAIYEAVEQAMLSESPAAVRRRVRDWLTALLHGEGAVVALDDPADWSDWDPEHRR